VKFKTTRFGDMELSDDKVIVMPDGMIGFEEQRYVLLTPERSGGFCWFQSVDNPDLAFVVVDPTAFFADYRVKLTRDEYDKLEMTEADEIIILTVATMSPLPGEITVNLQGPIVINSRTLKGKQIVLEDGKYKTREPLFPALQQSMSGQGGGKKEGKSPLHQVAAGSGKSGQSRPRA
jgi:flagellar assembly factor FliW